MEHDVFRAYYQRRADELQAALNDAADEQEMARIWRELEPYLKFLEKEQKNDHVGIPTDR